MFTEEVGVVNFGAVVFVEFLGGLAAVATGEFEVFTTFFGCPFEHGLPKGGADAFATDGVVGDEIFEVGIFADAGAH